MKEELHICDRCGAEINIPKEKKWYDCITPHSRKMKFKKPVSLREYETNIHQNIVLPEPELNQIDSIRIKEYYCDELKDFDLCNECMEDFEMFMRNENINTKNSTKSG